MPNAPAIPKARALEVLIIGSGDMNGKASGLRLGGCGGHTETTIGMTTRLEWDCPSGGETVLYVAADAGHTWSGTQPTDPEEETIGNEAISQDISATEVIWEFFARHSRD